MTPDIQNRKKYSKWSLWLLFVTGLLVTACTTTAEPKVYQIGMLNGSSAFNDTIDGFKANMTELGYVEGENIRYDVQTADGDREKMQQIAEKFVADKVDLIFTTTTGAAVAAKAATTESEIPVVFTVVADPIGSGVVADLRQPGGNVTGATRSLSGIISKRIVFLHQIAPEVKRLWLPYEQGYANVDLTREAIQEAADSLNIELEIIETPVESVEALVAETEKMSATDNPEIDAIFISPDPTMQNATSIETILAFAGDYKLPVVANVPDQVSQGALLTYSDNSYETGQQGAPLADKILKGTDAGTLPVVFVEPHLHINYKTAQAFGLTVDDTLLAQASEIIR